MKIFSIKLIILLCVGFIGIAATFSITNSSKKIESKYKSIEKFITENKVEAEIISKGGHQEKCITLNLRNITPDTLYIVLEPGRRLISEDTTLQDILIVKQELMALYPRQQLSINGYGFCCEATMHSPNVKSIFSVGYMAPPTWVKLAKTINENNFPTNAVQSAIWVLSNNHQISSIVDEDPERVQLLKNTVASILGLEIPWYSISYEKDSVRVFSDRPKRVWGKIDYTIKNNSVVNVNVRNKSGKVMTTLVKGASKGPGEYVFDASVNVKDWPKGDYAIFIYEDFSNLNCKKEFKL